MRIYIIIGLLFLLNIEALGFDHSYKNWDKILKSYVIEDQEDTFFKYLDLKDSAEDMKVLKTTLRDFSSVTKKDYDSWTQNEKLSFLFNAYNAFTIDLILQHHSSKKPLSSIKDIGSLLKNTWKIEFFQFLGKKSNLDRIEHDIARKDFDEPRLHVAFNCASRSCPNLLNAAFTAKDLNAQLDAAARDFLNNKTKNYYKADDSTLYLSSIFKWYGDDFKKSEKFKSVFSFVALYMRLDPLIKANLLSKKVKIEYLDYDWRLNELR